MKKVIVTVVLVLVAVVNLWAKGAGTSAGIILDQPVSARASGMAEAYTAVGGEVGVVPYNPAGLVSLSKREASFTYQRGLADDNFMSLLYAHPTRFGIFAGAFSYYTAGEIELIDLDGDEWTAKAEQDYVVLAGFGRRVMKRVSGGINLKFLSSTLVEKETATSFAIDLGCLYETPVEGLALGLSLRNLGTKLKYITEGESLPFVVSLGAGYEKVFGTKKVLLAVDSPYLVNEGVVTPAVGVEFSWREMVQVRVGYKFNSDDTALTAGAGFTYKSILINYAFGLANRLENLQRVSVGVKF